MIFLDFETRSFIDLVKRGAHIYAAHPTTEIQCMSYAVDDDEMQIWHRGTPLPKDFLAYVKRKDCQIAAWNAQFERLMWNTPGLRQDFPPMPLNRFYCLAALARARGFPGKLEHAARFAETGFQKDMEGHRIMTRLCKPRDDGTWNEDPEDLRKQGEYCIIDSEVERAIFKMLVPFDPQELAAYHRTERINDRGICVDLALAEKVVKAVESEKVDFNLELAVLTEGAVKTPNQVAKIIKWCDSKGLTLPDLNKTTVADALADEEMSDDVRNVLEIREGAAKSAVGKFAAMLNRAGEDSTVRGLFMFRGAGQTGRYTSMGVQFHNQLRKSSPELIPVFMKRGLVGLEMIGSPMALLAQMVRPAFVAAAGRVFLIGDYAQIEARITAWLAEEAWLLEAFREGRDVYCEFGTDAFGRVITKADEQDRTISKHCVLGLGFGGAEGALRRSMKTQGNIVLEPEMETHLVQTYRDKCRKIKRYWYILRDAVLTAMYSRGTVVEIQGNVSYCYDGEHLWCKLPSGRLMCYPFAVIANDDFGNEIVRYRRGNRKPKSGRPDWPTVDLWYGMLMENLAQAIALDLLDRAQERIEDWLKLDIRGHCHDEIIAEVGEGEAAALLPKFFKTMEVLPSWAEGLPIKVEGKTDRRYNK